VQQAEGLNQNCSVNTWEAKGSIRISEAAIGVQVRMLSAPYGDLVCDCELY
jgi:hypothetical protein